MSSELRLKRLGIFRLTLVKRGSATGHELRSVERIKVDKRWKILTFFTMRMTFSQVRNTLLPLHESRLGKKPSSSKSLLMTSWRLDHAFPGPGFATLSGGCATHTKTATTKVPSNIPYASYLTIHQIFCSPDKSVVSKLMESVNHTW